MAPLAFIGSIGPSEMLVILVVGLLIFGARLPEVGRQLGRGLMEFKKGLRGFQDEVRNLEHSADREVEQELARRRAAAPAHDLEDDPRPSSEVKAPFAHEFVKGDPAAEEAARAAQSAAQGAPSAAPVAESEEPPVGTPWRTADEGPAPKAAPSTKRPPVDGTASFTRSRPGPSDAVDPTLRPDTP